MIFLLLSPLITVIPLLYRLQYNTSDINTSIRSSSSFQGSHFIMSFELLWYACKSLSGGLAEKYRMHNKQI